MRRRRDVPLDALYLKSPAKASGYKRQVIRIASHHQIAARKGSDDHDSVDNVAGTSSGARGSDHAGARFREILDTASTQQSGERSLGTAAPGLCQHRGRDHGSITPVKRTSMQSPQIAAVRLTGE